ncbi:MAG: type 1 glutamine amidotransferase [Deltaproteobacteria bacterium]|nr:MAG: type 1 glutamine amidotransferase [Deltaproteobacteria bacterium]
MRLHFLEHDPDYFSNTNITLWAETKGYQVTNTDLFKMEKLPSLSDFDWLMIMGGSQHAWEEEVHPWLVEEKQFIANALSERKIILGICFGAQLLAEVLGGRVYPKRKEEIGWYEVTLNKEGLDSFLFKSVPDRFLTFHWHSDHFALPVRCTRLAFSKATANQAYIHNDSCAVGIQFHPEYTREMIRFFSKEYGHEWVKGPYVAGKEAVLAMTEQVPETYWLMETFLNNMDHQFGKF